MDFPVNRHAQHSAWYREVTVHAFGADTKGLWWPVISQLPYAASGLIINPYDINSATDANVFLDIAIGAPGDEGVIVQDLLFCTSANTYLCNDAVFLPIALPAGARVSVRAQADLLITGSPTGMQIVVGIAPVFGGSAKYTLAESIGCDYANTRGASYVGSGTDVASATWYDVAASGFTRNVKAILPRLHNTATVTQWGVFQIGIGNPAVPIYTSPILAVFDVTTGAATKFTSPKISHPIPIAVPKGVRVAVRGYISGGGTRYMTVTGFA